MKPADPKPYILTKSRYVKGLQCSKALFLKVNHPELESPLPSDLLDVFKTGNEVGARARQEFPSGVLIDSEAWEVDEAVSKTKIELDAGSQVLFEAAILHDEILIRVDVLKKNGEGWDLIEVKSSTSTRDEYLEDIAFQVWVARNAGYEIKNASLMFLSRECRYPDLKNLFQCEDVTATIETIIPKLPAVVAEQKRMLKGSSPPNIDIGRHCTKPYKCLFQEHCRQNIPKEGTIFQLPGQTWKLYEKGFVDLKDVTPEDVSATQIWPLEVIKSGKVGVRKEKLKTELQNWIFPRYYLDFETIMYAIPIHEGQRPYDQTPFQFSVQIQSKEGGDLVEKSYLHSSKSDPREPLAKALIEAIPNRGGTVIAYNASFERQRLEELAGLLRSMSEHLLSIAERLKDPLPLVRSAVYHPEFNGSYSIKYVAPALLGKNASYEGMDVADGRAAGRAYLKLIDNECATEDREELKRSLLEYCAKDTLMMVKVVDWIEEVAES